MELDDLKAKLEQFNEKEAQIKTLTRELSDAQEEISELRQKADELKAVN